MDFYNTATAVEGLQIATSNTVHAWIGTNASASSPKYKVTYVYEGEIPELKIECECRKPKPGMLIQAAKDYNIDLSQSWMIGDGENDVEAGVAAGCNAVQLGDKYKTLLEFVNDIIKEK